MRLIWFQRPDGLWNAECTCGVVCVGVTYEDRSPFEKRHLQRAAADREQNNTRTPCGPKFPESNVNMPDILVFP